MRLGARLLTAKNNERVLDVIVTCDERDHRHSDDPDRYPKLVVEILSPNAVTILRRRWTSTVRFRPLKNTRLSTRGSAGFVSSARTLTASSLSTLTLSVGQRVLLRSITRSISMHFMTRSASSTECNVYAMHQAVMPCVGFRWNP